MRAQPLPGCYAPLAPHRSSSTQCARHSSLSLGQSLSVYTMGRAGGVACALLLLPSLGVCGGMRAWLCTIIEGTAAGVVQVV